MASDNDARIPLRFPLKMHSMVKVLAKAQGISMNQLVLDAVDREIHRIKDDEEVMSHVHDLLEAERQALAEFDEVTKPRPRKKTSKKRTRS